MFKYSCDNKNEQWEIRLAENKDLSRFNNQYRYWLVCIDVYSRYVWVELLKEKSGKNTANKFEKILKSDGPPQKIQCDEEREFQTIRKELKNIISQFFTRIIAILKLHMLKE